MSVEKIFKKIIQLLNPGKRASESKTGANQETAVMSKLFQMVANTEEVELSCDELFELLDHYVELEARGDEAAEILPLVKKHLDRCLDCHEEYEALLRIVQASTGFSA